MLTGISWGTNKGFDIHVIRGALPQQLDRLLLLLQDVGPEVTANAKPWPLGVTNVQFVPDFRGQPQAHGIKLDPSTGVVTFDPSYPTSPPLRNFLVRALVTHTNPLLNNPLEKAIRLHLHTAVTQIWLTPTQLTVHLDTDDHRFTLLAEFDDGTMGNVTDLPGLTWTSDRTDVHVDSAGFLRGDGLVDSAKITVTMTVPVKDPSGLIQNKALTHSATARCIASWTDHKTVTFVPSPGPPAPTARSGAANWDKVPNILFLSEGFVDGEESDFEALVHAIVDHLGTWKSTLPFNLMKDSVNYWMAFVPSPQPGISVLSESYLSSSVGAAQFCSAVPAPQAPTGATWTLPNLIHQVGLPVPADDNPDPAKATPLAAKIGYWNTLYNVSLSAGPLASLYNAWLQLASRRLLNETDTAFGFAIGQWPRVDAPLLPARNIDFHPGRMQPVFLMLFLESLYVGSTNIGTTWTKSTDPSGKVHPSKDNGLVCFLARADIAAGTNTTPLPRPAHSYALTLGDRPECPIDTTIPGPGTWLDVMALPGFSVSPNVVGTVAHESAHSLGLGDEYGESIQLPNPIPTELAGVINAGGNVQLRSDLVTTARPGGPEILQGDKIKWRWPRIAQAGVVVNQIGTGWQILLRSGHGTAFGRGDRGRLRRRPLTDYPAASDLLEIVTNVTPGVTVAGVTGDAFTVRVVPGGSVSPAQYPPDSIFFVPVRDASGNELDLVAPVILQHITTHVDPASGSIISPGGPLNVPATAPMGPCKPDARNPQPALNLPPAVPGKPFPRIPEVMIGLYEGGARVYCGVYHPSGLCVMRREPDNDDFHVIVTIFCHVCRYVLVDRIEPTLHRTIDQLYSTIYPG